MGLFSGLFGSSSTSSNPIADLQAQYLPDIYKQAQQQYEAGQLAPNYYPGQTLTGFDPVRAQGVNIGVDTALGAQTDLAQGQTDLLTNILSGCLLYTSPSPRDRQKSRMPSSA